MSEDVDQLGVGELARAFARHLEHLRDFRGLHYVGAAPIPGLDEGPSDEVVAEAPAQTPATETQASEAPARTRDTPPQAPARTPATAPSQPATTRNRPPRQSAQSAGAPTDRRQSPPGGNRSSSASSSSVREQQREVLRARAEQWSPAKKLTYLRDRNVGDCRRCVLSKTRRNIVFGVGNPEADLMFVGEAPGGEEDRLGEPFVGPAGRRLDMWLETLGLRREQVYIANVLKCRPPGNRDPRPQEIAKCSPFLHAQIRAIEPKVLVALGRFAGCLLLGEDRKLYQMRGAVHRYTEPKSKTEVPLVVTYHPSYVLRRDKETRGARGAQRKTDQGRAINPEDEKVLADLGRAVALFRGPTLS